MHMSLENATAKTFVVIAGVSRSKRCGCVQRRILSRLAHSEFM